MSVVMERAEALAKAIAESDELKDARAWQEKINGDEEAEAIIQEFFQLQTQIMQAEEKGEEPSDELNQAFNAVQDKMEANFKVAKYYQSQALLGHLLQEINELITEAVTGEGCSEEDCAKCEGCS